MSEHRFSAFSQIWFGHQVYFLYLRAIHQMGQHLLTSHCKTESTHCLEIRKRDWLRKFQNHICTVTGQFFSSNRPMPSQAVKSCNYGNELLILYLSSCLSRESAHWPASYDFKRHNLPADIRHCVPLCENLFRQPAHGDWQDVKMLAACVSGTRFKLQMQRNIHVFCFKNTP